MAKVELSTRDIIRTLVRRIEIDHSDIEVVFRVPPPNNSPLPPPGPAYSDFPNQQDCTGGRGEDDRLAKSLPPPGQGVGMPEPERARFPAPGLNPDNRSNTLMWTALGRSMGACSERAARWT